MSKLVLTLTNICLQQRLFRFYFLSNYNQDMQGLVLAQTVYKRCTEPPWHRSLIWSLKFGIWLLPFLSSKTWHDKQGVDLTENLTTLFTSIQQRFVKQKVAHKHTLLYLLFYPKCFHNSQNEHHAALNKTQNIYWGNKSRCSIIF